MIKKWSAQSYPGCPIIQRSSKEVTYNQINTGDQTNIETSEPNKYSTPTCIKPVVHTQNNQYTFAQLPRLKTTHEQQSIKGTPSRTRNKKPGAKLNPKQKPARIDKTVTRENHTYSPSTPRPKTQTSIMDYINKGKKRLNLVQLTASDNNKN